MLSRSAACGAYDNAAHAAYDNAACAAYDNATHEAYDIAAHRAHHTPSAYVCSNAAQRACGNVVRHGIANYTLHLHISFQAFYIDLRRSMFHVALSKSAPQDVKIPSSRADFEAMPTAKLRALLNILQHHLAHPRAAPMNVKKEFQGRLLSQLPPFPEPNTLVPIEGFEYSHYAGDGPDKIIVFSFFPSNNIVLENVSSLPLLTHLTYPPY